MSANVGSFAWHLEQLGEHPCCWVVSQEMCGLWCGHGGEHLPFVPGAYLQLPYELGPLEVLRVRLSRWPWICCPVCGARVDLFGRKWVGLVSWDVGDERRIGTEISWEFRPCGCEAREVDR